MVPIARGDAGRVASRAATYGFRSNDLDASKERVLQLYINLQDMSGPFLHVWRRSQFSS